MDEDFNVLGLNRFGVAPGGGPGISIEARGRFFGTCLFGIARGTNFFGMWIWGFGFGLMRFEFAASFVPRFRFACCFFFGITTSLYSESSSSESSSLKASHPRGFSFFHRVSGKTFFMSRTPSCLTQIWMQKILWQKKHDLLPSRRIIWFQCIEVLDVSDSKLRWSLVKIGIGQPCRSNKRAGINRRLFWPTRCARRARADGICNYSWFANARFSQLQLPRFHNGL